MDTKKQQAADLLAAAEAALNEMTNNLEDYGECYCRNLPDYPKGWCVCCHLRTAIAKYKKTYPNGY